MVSNLNAAAKTTAREKDGGGRQVKAQSKLDRRSHGQQLGWGSWRRGPKFEFERPSLVLTRGAGPEQSAAVVLAISRLSFLLVIRKEIIGERKQDAHRLGLWVGRESLDPLLVHACHALQRWASQHIMLQHVSMCGTAYSCI